LGVPVLAYGKTRDFPAFFMPRSGFEVRFSDSPYAFPLTPSQAPWNVKDPATAANVLCTHCKRPPSHSLLTTRAFTVAQWQLGMENGALIAVPIPEEYDAVGAAIQRAVDQAVAESEENGISKRGKEATPWLLSRIGALTKGESLASSSYTPHLSIVRQF
jgi:pseudouridine-5'-phosphate glycosidase/pseudouridine kinase